MYYLLEQKRLPARPRPHPRPGRAGCAAEAASDPSWTGGRSRPALPCAALITPPCAPGPPRIRAFRGSNDRKSKADGKGREIGSTVSTKLPRPPPRVTKKKKKMFLDDHQERLIMSTPAANLQCNPSTATPTTATPRSADAPPAPASPSPPSSSKPPRCGGLLPELGSPPRPRPRPTPPLRAAPRPQPVSLTPRYVLTPATCAPSPGARGHTPVPGLPPPGGRALCLPRGPPTPAPEDGPPGASPAQEEPQLFVPRAGQAPGLPAPPGAEGSAPEDVEETDGD